MIGIFIGGFLFTILGIYIFISGTNKNRPEDVVTGILMSIISASVISITGTAIITENSSSETVLDYDTLMESMCRLYDSGAINTKELMRMDDRCLQKIFKLNDVDENGLKK